MLPSFLIIGIQRAGTAPLFNILRQHPEVVGPTGIHENLSWSRELHFFDDRFERGLNWYRSCFPLRTNQVVGRLKGTAVLAGEATSSYLYEPAVPERVAATLPDARMIALLRHPVERAYWHFESNRRKGLETRSFEEALDAEDRGAPDEYAYVRRGFYADHLERWFAAFPRERFLVLRAEDLAAGPADTYAEVLTFLALRTWTPPRFPPINWMSPAPIDAALRGRLEDRFAEPNARLARLLGGESLWQRPAGAPPATAATPTRQS